MPANTETPPSPGERQSGAAAANRVSANESIGAAVRELPGSLSLLVPCGSPLGTTASEEKQPPLASGSNTAAQPQFHELAPVRASRLAAFRQTPAEDREITDRLLTIGSGVSS